jgi:hypothetical protein
MILAIAYNYHMNNAMVHNMKKPFKNVKLSQYAAARKVMAEGKSLPSMADIDKQFYELESQISDLEAKGVEVGKEHPLSKKWQQLVSMKQRILRKNLKKGVA